MTKTITFDETTTAGHMCSFYRDEQERLELITEYIRQGLAKNELCILATAASQKQTQKDFLQYGLETDGAIKKGDLRIFDMQSTYISENRFDTDYMLGNVQAFIEDAKLLGYSGLRTAGEMKWLTQHPEAVEDAITYEQKVNSLGVPGFSFVGLCLYSMEGTKDNLLQGALTTHPTLFYDGTLSRSPLFVAA